MIKINVLIGYIDSPNKNGVVYTPDVVKKLKKRIEVNGFIYGENGNPDLSDIPNMNEAKRRMRIIDVKRISHKIHDVIIEGNEVLLTVEPSGDMSFANNPALGNDVPSFGIRALGPFRKDTKGNRVYDMQDAQLLTWDYLPFN